MCPAGSCSAACLWQRGRPVLWLRGLDLPGGGELAFLAGKQPLLHPVIQRVQGAVQTHAQGLGQQVWLNGFPSVAQHPQQNLQLLLASQFYIAVHQGGGHSEYAAPRPHM